jgi:hypothetical protein
MEMILKKILEGKMVKCASCKEHFVKNGSDQCETCLWYEAYQDMAEQNKLMYQELINMGSQFVKEWGLVL